MLGNLGVHIIKYPTGRFGFVGTLPAILGDVVDATTSDIMAGRAHTNPHTGRAVALKFPSFDSYRAAWDYATDKGIMVKGWDK